MGEVIRFPLEVPGYGTIENRRQFDVFRRHYRHLAQAHRCACERLESIEAKCECACLDRSGDPMDIQVEVIF